MEENRLTEEFKGKLRNSVDRFQQTRGRGEKELHSLFLTEVQIGTVESIEFLLSLTKNKKFLDYKSFGEYNPMLFAVLRGSTELIDYLLSLGYNFKSIGNSKLNFVRSEAQNPFLFAIQQRRPVEFLDFLLKRGCELDSVNFYQQNAFLLAIITYSPFPDNNTHPYILCHLFDRYNFNIDIFHNDQWRKLYNNNDIDNEKLKIRRKEVLQFLIKKGINFRAKDLHKRSAIHYAAIMRDLDLLQFFVSLKINIKELDLDLQNTIHMASVFPPNLEMIKYLVSLKISPSKVDANNLSAIIITLSTATRKLVENSNEILKQPLKETLEYFISKKSPITTWKRKQLKNDLFIELLKNVEDWEMIKFVYSLYSEKVVYPITLRPLQYIFSFDVRIYNFLISNNIDNEFIYPPLQNDDNIISNPKSKRAKKDDPPERFAILHDLIRKFSSDTQNIPFRRFKECFEYFLQRGNSINEPNADMQMPIQILNFRSDIALLWKFTRYLIDKGSNLHHVSHLGSIMHNLISGHSCFNDFDYDDNDDDNEGLSLEKINLLKYILVRSLDVNPFDQAIKKGVTGFKRKIALQYHPVKKNNFDEDNENSSEDDNEDQKVEDEVILEDENSYSIGIWKNAFTKYIFYSVPPLLTIVGQRNEKICFSHKDNTFFISRK